MTRKYKYGKEVSQTSIDVTKRLAGLRGARELGIVGDGVTDDTTNFKNAITEAINGNFYIRVPSGTYVLTTAVVTSGRVLCEENVLITGGGLLKGAKPLINGKPFTARDTADNYSAGFKNSLRKRFPENLPLDSITSMTNTTQGTDTDGAFYQLTEGTTSASQQITVDPSVTYVLKVKMKGTVQNALKVNFFQTGGTYVSTSYTYAFSSSGFVLNTDKAVEVVYGAIVVPATAGRMSFEFESFTGRSLKVYGAKAVKEEELPFSKVRPTGIPYKGISLQHVKREVAWLRTSTTISAMEIFNQLKWYKDTFKIPAFRIFLGLDSGMVKSGGVFANYNAVAFERLEALFTSADLLKLKVVPVLYTPIRAAAATTENFQRESMTNPAVLNGYLNATEQFIKAFDHHECIAAWDLINELHWMMEVDVGGTGNYTTQQINAVYEAVSDKVRSLSDKPIILSVADGKQGLAGMLTLREDSYDILDMHTYGSLLGGIRANMLNKPIIVGELGTALQSGYNDEVNFPGFNSTIIPRLETLMDYVGTAFVWQQYVVKSHETVSDNSALVNYLRYF